MKTFKNFLIEEDEITKFFQNVKRDCQFFLDEIDHNFLALFRGMKDRWPEQQKFQVRKDRKPLDTPELIHKFADEWFEEKYKIKFRSQALFCIGDHASATEFSDKSWETNGKSAINFVYPIGHFQYVWSTKIKDLFGTLKGVRELGPLYSGREDVDHSVIKKAVWNTLNEGDFKFNTGLDEAITRGGEIMIYCNEYYGIPDMMIWDHEDKMINILGLQHQW